MTKIIDSTNLGYLITKIKAAFWSKSDVIQIDLDDTPTANSDNLVKSGGVKSALDAKQDTLVSGTNIKTINNESLLGSGNISISGGSGEANVIEAVTFNGTPATITNKTATITATIPSTLDQISDGSTRKLSNYLPLAGGTMNDDAEVEFTDGEGSTVTIKPDTINLHNADDSWRVVIDPSDPGMTVGNDDFSSYTLYRQDGITNKTNSSTYYNIGFPNKNGTFALTSDIPSAVTESTVSGWGFTKNTGTYSKPSTGIPATDLASDVITVHLTSDGVLSSDISTVNGVSRIDGFDGATYALSSNTSDGSEDYILATTNQLPTESTVSGWGFTKNAAPGTLKTNNTTAQTTSASESLSGTINLHKVAKTGTYSDLIGTPTIPTKVSDLTNDSNFTSNTGTVTGVKINGTTKTPTSGTVDLGTVLTSETSLSKGTTTGSGNAVTDVSVNGHQITLTKGTTFLTSHQDISGKANLSGAVFTGAVTGTSSGNTGQFRNVTISSSEPTSSQGSNGDIWIVI